MEPIGKSIKVNGKSKGVKIEVNKYLHSPDHLLADELATKLNDHQHFGFYLKMATTQDHNVLRSILGQVLEGKNVQTPGRLFAYLIKKYNEQNSSK